MPDKIKYVLLARLRAVNMDDKKWQAAAQHDGVSDHFMEVDPAMDIYPTVVGAAIDEDGMMCKSFSRSELQPVSDGKYTTSIGDPPRFFTDDSKKVFKDTEGNFWAEWTEDFLEM